AKMHPVDHEGDQVQAVQPPAHQPRQRGLGRGHEPARDRRLAGCAGGVGHRGPGGLQPALVTARRQAREHLLQCHLAQDLGAPEQVIGGQAQLPGPAGGPHPGPGHRQPPPAQRHRSCSGAVPVPGPFGVVLAVRPAQLLSVLGEHGGHHLQPGADGQRQQALLRRLGDLGHRHDHLLRDGDLAGLGRARLLLVGVAHGGPSPSGVLSPFTRGLPSGRLRGRDRHSQVLRRRGHPPWWPFLVLALIRRRPRDWAVFAAYLAAVVAEIVTFAAAGILPVGTVADYVAAILFYAIILLVAVTAPVYTLVAFRPAAGLPSWSDAELARAAAKRQARAASGIVTICEGQGGFLRADDAGVLMRNFYGRT